MNIIVSLILLNLLKYKLVDCKYVVEKIPYKPNDAVVAISSDCSGFNENIFYDVKTQNWQIDRFSECSKTSKDILAYCQRIYPQLNVINILKENKNISFSIKNCDENEQCDNVNAASINTIIYSCLHGNLKSSKLVVPKNCEYYKLNEKQECQTDTDWKNYIENKCNQKNSYVYTYSFLQWCDAFNGGLSTFTGVEFVCCNKTKVSTDSLNPYDNLVEDEDIDNFEQINDNDNDSENTSEFLPSNSNKKMNFKIAKIPNNGMKYLLATISMLTMLSVFLYFVRKNVTNNRKPERILNNEENSNCNNEGNHLTNMQVNGYENPTYKYFESV